MPAGSRAGSTGCALLLELAHKLCVPLNLSCPDPSATADALQTAPNSDTLRHPATHSAPTTFPPPRSSLLLDQDAPESAPESGTLREASYPLESKEGMSSEEEEGASQYGACA